MFQELHDGEGRRPTYNAASGSLLSVAYQAGSTLSQLAVSSIKYLGPSIQA